ncbi:MAG: hypothetical protein ACE5GA_06990, partial [Candidatus Zixiibacteriota bacterium]
MTRLIKSENGSALIVALSVLLMSTLIAIQMFSLSDTDKEMSFANQNESRALYAAESGLSIARAQLWYDYIGWASTSPQKLPGKVGNKATYIKYLEQKMGLTAASKKTLVRDKDITTTSKVDSVTVQRLDDAGSIMLLVNSVGTSAEQGKQEITSVLRVEGAAFKGFDFAILAKNINCVMCHATIDNVDRVYNTDITKQGEFDRVKVASLESLLLRTTSADSKIAGTLYTRGIVTDKKGNPITDLSPSGTGLDGYQIDPTTGKILEPLSVAALTNTTGSPLPTNGNLYLNYPSDPAGMTDGELPEDFPPPFPDDNGNKVVDDAEYRNIADAALGSISGGVIYGVNKGSTYLGSGLPMSGNMTNVSKEFTGNLILVGTDKNPIVLNNDIAVDGDVVIQGKVVGNGQILARGNVYITGDLEYDDGNKAGLRTFGQSQNGKTNAISVASGKNILVGDYLTPKKGDINDNTSIDPGNLYGGEKFSFTMSEITLFNRGEWQKTQPTLADANGVQQPNPTYDPGYNPRYYTMNEGDPVYIFNKSYTDGKGKQKGTYFDPVSKSWKGKEHASAYDPNLLSKLDTGDPQLTGASTLALNSENNWISPQTLKDIWIADN